MACQDDSAADSSDSDSPGFEGAGNFDSAGSSGVAWTPSDEEERTVADCCWACTRCAADSTVACTVAAAAAVAAGHMNSWVASAVVAAAPLAHPSEEEADSNNPGY